MSAFLEWLLFNAAAGLFAYIVGWWLIPNLLFFIWRNASHYFRLRFHRDGCCSTCDGTGSDASAYETNGLCWDCRGTGHSHEMKWPNR